MKKFFVSLALVTLATSIGAPQSPLNTLTAKEKAEGWRLLFDDAR